MESLTFFFDRNFGRGFPKALRILNCPFIVKDHWELKFPDNMPDDEWLEVAGKNKWVVFSHDAKWHRESANAAAIEAHKVGCFYLYGASLPNFYKMRSFAHNFDKIMEICKGERGPYIYQVTSANRLRKIR